LIHFKSYVRLKIIKIKEVIEMKVCFWRFGGRDWIRQRFNKIIEILQNYETGLITKGEAFEDIELEIDRLKSEIMKVLGMEENLGPMVA